MAEVRQANILVLSVLGLVLGLVLMDYGRQAFFPAKGAQHAEAEDLPPMPKVGEVAPDFSLPDATGSIRSLASLVTKDTLLWFTCGCSHCRNAQVYVEALRSKLTREYGHVNVTTAPQEAEAAYRRNIKLAQQILYEPGSMSTGVQRRYRGHPCPRIYVLDGDRKILFISRSLQEENTTARDIALGLAEYLGFSTPTSPLPGKPQAPSWAAVTGDENPTPPIPTSLTAPLPGSGEAVAPQAPPPPLPVQGPVKKELPPYMAPLPDFATKK